jgi:PAS domain S-box-containing protein
MKILVVDDNALSRKLISQILERKGCDVLEAADGEEGLETARVHGPDLIISDALMPKMDGFNFLRALRKEPALQKIPFVFYSGVYTGQKEEELALSLGASAYIIKPKEPEELWSEIKTILKRGDQEEKIFMPVPIDTEEDYLKHYSEMVTLKIEEELRELEKANAENRERAKNYHDLFNSIRDVIVVTRFDGVIADVNSPALREVFGYEREEVVGRNIGFLYPHGGEGEAFESSAPASNPCGMPLREATFRKRSGAVFCGEMCAMKRCDEQGTPTADILMIRDISERKQAEEALRISEERRIHLQAGLALAAEVQAKLLPRCFPSLPGFAIVARCLPASQVGGDFYDWHEVSPGVLDLTLGDVMGNGMAAAMLMATVRAVIRAGTLMDRPAKAMQLASRALMSDLENSESFVTLFHARLDTTTRKLTYVDCGHGLVFLRRANGAVEDLLVRGLPLGVSTDETYQEGVIAFKKGDTLVLYSDGLIEALPELPVNNLALAGLLNCTWDAMEMVNRMATLTGLKYPPADDLTMLLVHCNE